VIALKRFLLIFILIAFISVSAYGANQQVVVQTLTYAATKAVTPPVRGENQYYMTLTGNLTITIAKTVKGDIAVFYFLCDATPRTIIFGNYFTASGNLVLVASQTSVIRFTYTGVTWKEEYRINGNSGTLPLSVQGDTLYASATNTWAILSKSTTATHYLSNTGTSNNPAWAQVALATGVSGILPAANGGSVATQTIRFHPSEFTPSPDGANNSCTVSTGYDRTNYRDYFEVTSGSVTQDYDMVAICKLPTDFVSFTANAISLDIYTVDYATSVATVTVYKNDNSTDVSASSVIATANTAWQTKTAAPAVTGYTAGDNVKILIKIGTGDTGADYVRIARVYYTYNTR